MASLQELAKHSTFAATKVTDAGLKELAGLQSLHSLYLTHCQVTDAGLKELAGLKSLQVLNLGDTEGDGRGTGVQPKEPASTVLV